MPINIIDPTEIVDWNHRIAAFPAATVFHTANWARVLKEAYGYQPVYLVEGKGDRFQGVLPLFHVQSRLTGRRGVSIPFTDVCPPLVGKDDVRERLFQAACDLGRARKWRAIEWRGAASDATEMPAPPSQRFLGHELDLGRTWPEIAAGFRASTRRNMRKAEKAGVGVTFENSCEAVDAFYRLNCLTRKDHGLPPQPLAFFKALHTHVIQPGLGMVVLANYQDRPVAGAVFLNFNGQAVYKYGASDRRCLHLRANNLVMGEGIRRLAGQGCTSLHFGRTDLDHHGLRQFKRGWGTTETPIQYCKYDLGQERFVSQEAALKTSYPVFERMPMPLLRLSGQVLYKHMG